MAEQNKLTPAEWEIMESIWGLKNQVSVRDVVEHAYPNGEKAYTTIQTIMNTLEKKGFLKCEKIGMVNFYKPTESREKIAKMELSQLLSRVFHGSVPALANFLMDSDNISLKEIQTIKDMLNQKEQQLRSEP